MFESSNQELELLSRTDQVRQILRIRPPRCTCSPDSLVVQENEFKDLEKPDGLHFGRVIEFEISGGRAHAAPQPVRCELEPKKGRLGPSGWCSKGGLHIPDSSELSENWFDYPLSESQPGKLFGGIEQEHQ